MTDREELPEELQQRLREQEEAIREQRQMEFEEAKPALTEAVETMLNSPVLFAGVANWPSDKRHALLGALHMLLHDIKEPPKNVDTAEELQKAKDELQSAVKTMFTNTASLVVRQTWDREKERDFAEAIYQLLGNALFFEVKDKGDVEEVSE